jgi:hypothetical protein
MNYVTFASFWLVAVLVILAVNSRRLAVRIPWLYWTGGIAFAIGGVLAAGYHRGPAANAWAIEAFVGFVLAALGGFGIPPRPPAKRDPRS